MARYALILNGKTVNVVEQDTAPTLAGTWVLAPTASVGASYNGSAFGAALLPTAITRLAFLRRFTGAERQALQLAAAHDPAAALGNRQQAADLRALLSDVEVAQFVDLNDPMTRSGVELLETLTIIGAGRADVILDTPTTAAELYAPAAF